MGKHIAFRATAENVRQIERIRKAYAVGRVEHTVADAIRIALEVTCRQLDAGARASAAGYVGDVGRFDSVAEYAAAE